MKRLFDSSRGQIMVLYAAGIATLLGAVALGTDVSVMYMNWQQTQKVADASALAGANFLSGITFPSTIDSSCTGQKDEASQVACTYAVKNGLAAGNLTISDTSTSVTVVARETNLPYFFAKALGMSTYQVGATATATSPGPVNTVNGGLLPLGLQCATPCASGSLVAGEPVSFGTKFISSVINLPGNWGWVDLDGSGGSTLEANIANGATGSFTIGQSIDTDPGQKNGPVTKGLNSRFSGCPTISDPCANGGDPSNIPAGDPCLGVVPVVDFAAAAKGGKTSVTIEAFAEVYLDPNTTSGTSIGGCYVSSVVGNTVTGSTQSFGPTAPPVLAN